MSRPVPYDMHEVSAGGGRFRQLQDAVRFAMPPRHAVLIIVALALVVAAVHTLLSKIARELDVGLKATIGYFSLGMAGAKPILATVNQTLSVRTERSGATLN